MSRSVKTADLQAGMRVTEDVLGKKGDVKVNKGEILSQLHVTKMKKWVGLDAANPGGIYVESTPMHSGRAIPSVVDRPWESPVVEGQAKKKMQSKMQVDCAFDKEGNIINETVKPVKRRGRPKTKRT